MKIIVAYVPVLYSGYERFFERHKDADTLALFGPQTVSRFDWLRKDLRRLSFERLIQTIRSWEIFKEVVFLEDIPKVKLESADLIVMPDETECREIAQIDFAGMPVIFESVKLRYDKKRTEMISAIDAPIVTSELALRMMKLALIEAEKTPDWWLQVGAIFARNGDIILIGHNEHKPDDREALFMGDPRSNYSKGVAVELSISDHGEYVLVGESARRGISLAGCDLYITTFPCAPCTGLVVRAGISRCFFKDGWVRMAEGEEIFKSAGVEVFRVRF